MLVVGAWNAIGPPMHGLTESRRLGCNRSDGVGGPVCEGAALGLSMPSLGFFGPERLLHLQSLVRILLIDVTFVQLLSLRGPMQYFSTSDAVGISISSLIKP